MIGGFSAAALLAAAAAASAGFALLWAVALVAVVLALFLTWFFRDPERTALASAASLISPADGRVVAVDADLAEGRYLRRRAIRVAIFMSPLDVHVNRIPADGEVIGVHYNPGRFLAAFSDKASLDNEQNGIVLRLSEGREIAFVQIAGFLARRIVCRVVPGDRCRRGERMGMIKLGSRVDVWVPPPFRTTVRVGDRVRAGETVLGILE